MEQLMKFYIRTTLWGDKLTVNPMRLYYGDDNMPMFDDEDNELLYKLNDPTIAHIELISHTNETGMKTYKILYDKIRNQFTLLYDDVKPPEKHYSYVMGKKNIKYNDNDFMEWFSIGRLAKQTFLEPQFMNGSPSEFYNYMYNLVKWCKYKHPTIEYWKETRNVPLK